MPLSELTDRDAVLAALREYDAMGQQAFLSKYGYSPARAYKLMHEGKSYDSKAIVGAAFQYQFPERGPLNHSEFSGGEDTVVPLLRKLGFHVDTPKQPTISAHDIQLIRQSKTKSRYSELSSEERDAYKRVHENLEQLGSIVRSNLGQSSAYAIKLTSGFNPNSGIRGYLPKDLWFAVSNRHNYDVLVGMPQLFMIVSERGIEYGFAASIHHSDFSDQTIKQRVRAAAPEIFKELPVPGSPSASSLQAALSKTGSWYLRRKTRLDPNVQDFQSLDDWLSFLKSSAGTDWGAGTVSRYISIDDLQTQQPDLASSMQELGTTFSTLMEGITAIQEIQNPIQKGFEEFLDVYPSTRATVAFGQHDELKSKLNRLKSALEGLPALKVRPHVRVSWSVGQGNFSRVPWIALMDERETTSTQRGTYCVFLFPEDMSGVYLTLNQGVTSTIDAKGRVEGRRILNQQAEAMRLVVRPELGLFALDNSIDLHTDGVLGQDYEASTIAYQHYVKGKIPDDVVLNDHLDQLLTGYDRILEHRPTEHQSSSQWWIFQANPKIFNIDDAILELPYLSWTVKHDATRAFVGDRVFFWRAGREAGVIALGTITEAAAQRTSPAEEERYILNAEKLGGSQTRVLVRIDRRLDEPLLRSTIAAEPRLKDLGILRFANYGTFKVSTHHAESILEMIESVESAPVETSKGTRGVWVYAPGENAEYWDEFYEDGIMAIGWDEIGDLNQYGSLDDVFAGFEREFALERRPTNNARTCYDFAHSIKVGDRVFVKRGRNTIVGFGTVTGPYEFKSERQHFKHVRGVRWEGRGAWVSPAPLAVKTLTSIGDYASFIAALENLTSKPQTEAPKPIPAAEREPFTAEQALNGLFMDEERFRRALAIWQQKKNLILQGAPGVGKSFLARRLAYAVMGYRDPSRVRTVQFHQSYSYEDFVQGYRPTGEGLQLQKGVFLEFCERALADPEEIYVFTIDEINRGNLSKILGELMLLIEPDKRSSEWATKLAYAPESEERFYVPSNVYILGMMNTADRSLSLVDYALRRRFAFLSLRPEYRSEKFKQHIHEKGAPDHLIDRIINRMASLNEEIATDQANLGPGYCIGHSFFSTVAPGEVLDNDWYLRVIETEIVPLLEEYWFDNPTRAAEWRERLIAE